MVTEEEPADMELASEMIPVPEVPVQEEVQQEEMANQEEDIPQAKKSRTRKKKLHSDIRTQMEFYFSDANLTKDRFLANLLKDDPCKFVDIEVFLQFNKIRSLTTDPKRIAKALQNSTILEVSEDGTKVRRINPLIKKENIDECTIYVQRLPRDADHDMLRSIFSHYGPIAYISIPTYKQSKNIKGFAFVEFDKQEDAEKCLKAFRSKGYELPSETSPSHVLSITTYNDSENISEEANEKEKVGVSNLEKPEGRQKMEIEKETKNEIEVETEKGVKTESENEEQIVKKAKKRPALEPLNSSTEEDKQAVKKSKPKKKREETCDESGTESKKKTKIERDIKTESDSEVHVAKSDHKKNKKQRKHSDGMVKFEDTTCPEKKPKNVDSECEGSQLTESPKKSKKRQKLANGVEEQEVEPAKKLRSEEVSQESGSKIKDIEKKKKNRHKGYRKSEKLDATDMGLQVMAKKDWKKLRNKYLDLQRTKMRQLKQHLFKTRRNQRANSERTKVEREESEEVKGIPKQEGIRAFSFTPGLIVKLEMDQPVVDVQAFKKEFKGNSSVKYVDVAENATTAYIRLDTVEAAKEMAQKSTSERQTSVIKDDEEKWYWDKMMADRADKLSNKVKVNQRGRNKLLKKAEKELGKHIKFE